MLQVLFSIIGVIYVLSLLKRVLKVLYYHFKKPLNFKQRYGKNTWVVITGSTDGIGKEFALQFAKMKDFNIVQVARNDQKIKKVEDELRSLNPEIQLKSILANFSDGLQKDFYSKIGSQLEGLDISVLINNVGIGDLYEQGEQSDSDIQETLTVNINSQVFMTKLIAPKMKLRQKKSAIISLSSNAALEMKPYQALYSGTKGFNLLFSQNLSMEFLGKIDCLAVCPSMVDTPILRDKCTDPKVYQKAKRLMITPTQFVYSVFQQLGETDQTIGHIKHKIKKWVLENIPNNKNILYKMGQFGYQQTKNTRDQNSKKQQ